MCVGGFLLILIRFIFFVVACYQAMAPLLRVVVSVCVEIKADSPNSHVSVWSDTSSTQYTPAASPPWTGNVTI